MLLPSFLLMIISKLSLFSSSEEDLLENKLRRRQFIKDYAQKLHDYIWKQLPELTPKECVIFDMVPYTIWNEMSEKYTTIIDKIKELHVQTR